MLKLDAIEAKIITDATLDALLEWTDTRGRAGSDLRTAVGDVKAKSYRLLQTDTIAIPLVRCFGLALSSGITLPQMETVRRVALDQAAVSVGAIMTRDTLIAMSLATSGRIISEMEFVSREDVEKVKTWMQKAFEQIQEDLADRMDSMTWRAVIKLHAAVSMHLVETARPLPRILRFRFHQVSSTLLMAHRLYANAGRADELRRENKVVHPAFAPLQGIALSA